MIGNRRDFLSACFDKAIEAVQPSSCIARFVPDPPRGRTIVIGAGKASAAMAKSLEKYFKGPLTGTVVTRYGYNVQCEFINVIQASHPIPDETGVRAAKIILEEVQDLTEDDLVICLISGGGSSLLTLPASDLTIIEKQLINKKLLICGATVSEINTVRKHISRIKGGQLALACLPAPVLTLAISDVVGDDPSVIASGPTVPDRSTCDQALKILEKYEITEPKSILNYLRSKKKVESKLAPKAFNKLKFEMIANNRMALEASANFAKKSGITPIILDEGLQGEAKKMGYDLADEVQKYINAKPCLLLSGGELTVNVTGTGKGGPNMEFLLALALGLNGRSDVSAVACDTDGIDGFSEYAGAFIKPETLVAARKVGLNPNFMLANNDSYNFFKELDSLVLTGPTYTNVNDFRAILICD